MASAAASEETKESDEWVVVKTTLPAKPMPPNAQRSTVTTERLLLRPFVAEDVNALYALRTQEVVMRWTKAGRIDAGLAETQAKLDLFLPPNDTKTHNCAICLKDTGELIGLGGMHRLAGEFGWPEIGYMFRSDAWGKGYATEFLRAFLGAWDELPRAEVEINVKKSSVAGEGDVVEERLLAHIEVANAKSEKILVKCGFERYLDWRESDWRDPKQPLDLASFRHFPGRVARG